jgi:heat shock protein HspQ/uncharacterized protein YceK
MKKIIFLSIITLTFIGCGTIFKGSSADIRFNSSPAGADIMINNIDKGTTPQTIGLKRNQNHVVTFKKDGYKDVTMEITKKFDIGTTVIGNIFSWGLIGIIVDVANGAAYSLEPYDLQANMESLQAAGYIPSDLEVKKDEVHVFMLTSEEWKALQKSE